MLGDIARWGLTAVVLIAAVIGVPFVTRGTAVRRVRGVGADGVPVGVSEPDHVAPVMDHCYETDASLSGHPIPL
jgi:hypothetical protein